MYVHLGSNYIIFFRDIIAILNIEPPISHDLKDIIDVAKIDRCLVNISEKGKEKSLVICDDKLYLSPISSNTLFKRAANR